ncbi:hypothetical protein [Parafilimonas sp.]|uniref:hypothetical protein n=1 Tax=Parafilimonas sp. TaxID=1969739 RepID=UPI0039E22C1E
MKFAIVAFISSVVCLLQTHLHAQDFSFNGKDVSVVYSQEGPKLDSIAANLLAEDIQRVLDRMLIKFGDVPQSYGVVAETWKE